MRPVRYADTRTGLEWSRRAGIEPAAQHGFCGLTSGDYVRTDDGRVYRFEADERDRVTCVEQDEEFSGRLAHWMMTGKNKCPA